MIRFGREICGDLGAAERHEWVVTNGLGGYASGTVAGLLTRRYHGLLIAALTPPLGRTLMVAKLDEIAAYAGHEFPFSTNRWADGTIDPSGYRRIEHFRLEGTTPVWTYACADALVEKRIWMPPGENTTYVQYQLKRSSGPLALELKALVNYRDFHATTRGQGRRMRIDPVGKGLRIVAYDGATPFHIVGDGAVPAHDWYYGFDLARERERGLEDREDHLHAGTVRATLSPGESLTLAIGTQAEPTLDSVAASQTHRVYEEQLIARWAAAFPAAAKRSPAWVRQLALAADQFVVSRSLPHDANGRSLIAGYHWFGDWGRDTMISLPGLVLTTGRAEIARSILRTYSRFADQGMLPNRLPNAAAEPEYNTVDAALWYVAAVDAYHTATHDDGLLRELFPVLADIVAWHQKGTRYGIHMDLADGLLYAGAPGQQLTWMDAKVGEWVVTPRIGKPVEINALWYNALRALVAFARRLRKPADEYEALAARCGSGFSRFWNDAAGYCFDVIDGPGGADAALRPNQLLAVSLPASPLTAVQQQMVVDVCARHLLTSRGLRSLAPGHPAYRGHYGGDQQDRDGAYYQGTVWGWLLGPSCSPTSVCTAIRCRPAHFSSPWPIICPPTGSARSARSSTAIHHSVPMAASLRPGPWPKSSARG